MQDRDRQDDIVVSVIMAAHNSERFIAESMRSVQLQSFSALELIVVDDCSTDSTPEVVREFAKSDSRLRLIELPENAGPAVARSVGIAQSRGRFVALLDSDDLWESGKLERQLSVMSETGAPLSFTAYRKLLPNGAISKAVITVPKRVEYHDLLKTNSIGCLTAMFDTAFFGRPEMPNIRLRQDYALWLTLLRRVGHEDYSFWLDLLKPRSAGDKRYAIGINEPLAVYRLHDHTVSSNKLKAAAYQWLVYRKHERLGIVRAAFFFLHYALHGTRKYFKR